MAKIGIITIQHGYNYGNRLQNYALQEVLQSLGHDVFTMRRNVYDSKLSEAKNLLSEKYHERRNPDYMARVDAFKRFNAKNIKYSREILYKRKDNKKIGEVYDTFIVGSDQIWNPNWAFNSSIDFASFAPKNKRISYAASFGVEEIPEEKKSSYGRYLSDMKMISVREESAAKLVKDLSGRDCITVLDLTLLVTKPAWIQIERKPPFELPKKYVIYYFLGRVSEEQNRYIQNVAATMKATIIDLNSKSGQFYSIGPDEFLYLIRHAIAVCTDSFHGTVFSIIFETPFITFKRNYGKSDMSNRLSTLLKLTNLEKRLVSTEDPVEKQLLDMDFSEARHLIEENGFKSRSYLREAVGDLN